MTKVPFFAIKYKYSNYKIGPTSLVNVPPNLNLKFIKLVVVCQSLITIVISQNYRIIMHDRQT